MAMTLSLAGRVAVVAGAGRGIGAAVAGRLAEAGAAVVDSRRDRAEATVGAIREPGGSAAPVVADLLDAQCGTQIVEQTTRLGGVDIHANVAGGSWAYAPYRRIHEATEDEWCTVSRSETRLCVVA
jgi:NAD(P)-dependent dehydrogenase (short-subunit alcohol dehydrogenase family)